MLEHERLKLFLECDDFFTERAIYDPFYNICDGFEICKSFKYPFIVPPREMLSDSSNFVLTQYIDHEVRAFVQ